MRKTLRIARREYGAQVRTKGFIIGLAIAPILMCGGLFAFFLLKDRVDLTDKRIAVVDRSGVLAGRLAEEARKRSETEVYDAESGKKVKPAYIFEIVPPDDEKPEAQRLALSDRVRAKDLYTMKPRILRTVRRNSRSTYRQSSYRVGIFVQGKPPRIGTLLRWLVRG